jgi:4-hydroxybenzoate polyprenyltransferase
MRGSQPKKAAHERFQRLSAVQENHLARWIAAQAALGLPPTHGKLRFYATEILRAYGDTEPLGKRWTEGFFRRNPQIQVHRGLRMENARVKGVTTEIIRKWWPALRIPAVAVIKPENRYNVDEGGFIEGKAGNGLVLGLRRTRPLQKKKPGLHAWTSFIECISATGLGSLPSSFLRENTYRTNGIQRI